MTALPLRDFSDAERAKLAAIEAAPAAEESVRERVADAIMDADYEQATGGLLLWSDLDANEQGHFRRLADAALAVLSGPSSDAEQVAERVLALAAAMEREAPKPQVGGFFAEAIRTAVAGPTC